MSRMNKKIAAELLAVLTDEAMAKSTLPDMQKAHAQVCEVLARNGVEANVCNRWLRQAGADAALGRLLQFVRKRNQLIVQEARASKGWAPFVRGVAAHHADSTRAKPRPKAVEEAVARFLATFDDALNGPWEVIEVKPRGTIGAIRLADPAHFDAICQCVV